jgi:lipoate---protein ligase
MRGIVVCKVPGGKLLRVSVDHEGSRIVAVKFTGDFFVHPEEAVERLEGRLAGAALSDVRRIVDEEFADARLYGLDSNTMVKSVWEAFG